MSEDKANLGLATTRELFDELMKRFEVHADGGLDYRTVNEEEIAQSNTKRRLQQLEKLGFTDAANFARNPSIK